MPETPLDTDQLNLHQLNAFLGPPACAGLTLGELRQRLQNELSSYAPNTLVTNDPTNDIELQFLNDGISMLWPHDYQVVMCSVNTKDSKNHRFQLPDDCEHVFSVYRADQDVNNDTVSLTGLPPSDSWYFDKSFIRPVSKSTLEGGIWTDQAMKSLWVRPCSTPWIVARYARKWPAMANEEDCIDPSPNRILAVVFYASYQYFVSQMQVNTESIRYRNYQAIAQQFYQYYQQLLVRDSKPLFIV